MEVCSYASDLTDAEWALLEALIPRSHPTGRRQTYRSGASLTHLLSAAHRRPVAAATARVPSALRRV
jgi:transposase